MSNISPVVELRQACQDGNLETVRELLKKLRSDEICSPDDNGFTALHIAVIRGHVDIITLLAERYCARTVRTTEGLTASEMAPHENIRLLMKRSNNRNSRFVKKPYFFKTSAFGLWRYIVNPYRLVECGYYEKEGVEERRKFIMNWLKKNLSNIDEFDLLASYFQQAFMRDSTKPILMALTEETSFYDKISECLLNEQENREFEKNEFVGPLLIARNIFKAVYDGEHGENYNGLPLFAKASLTEAEIQWYEEQCGKSDVSLKIFWSLTQLRDIALEKDGNVLFVLICKETTTQRTLCLHNISGYPDELEVLMSPMTKMKVTSVQKCASAIYEIHLLYWDW